MMMSVDSPALPSPYHAYRGSYHAPLLIPHHTTASSYHQHPRQQSLSQLYEPSASAQDHFSSTHAYMNPTLPQPPLQHSFTLSPHHGIKRSAPEPDDEFERSNHISNHFKKLRLNNNTNQQVPSLSTLTHSTPHIAQPHATTRPLTHEPSLNHEPNSPFPQPSSGPTKVPTLPSDDFMTVDDTPHKIYISDLDSEIAAIEAAERSSSQLFLPDFEKQIGAIPDHVLKSSSSSHPHNSGSGGRPDESPHAPPPNQALVLYQDPSSISVPEEEDAVRKAILDARRGIRERMRRQSQRDRETAHLDLANMVRGRAGPVGYDMSPPILTNGEGTVGGKETTDGLDEDAMDIE